ncbi:hypothetical protein [Isoptericola variabilis]|uniref:hypothetical protein n=1 Tax=Isoptericola variabilis TaxID=139208 RepID=UPI0002F90860|nr:hypothetical protein [Isoptericola variabilis]TWH34132.1 dihydrolipoamide dehydrogenase [Isoptericola variabilis J7]
MPGVGDPGPLGPDAVLAWRDEVTHDWDDASQVEWLDGAGIALVRGQAALAADGILAGLRRAADAAAPGSAAPDPTAQGAADRLGA